MALLSLYLLWTVNANSAVYVNLFVSEYTMCSKKYTTPPNPQRQLDSGRVIPEIFATIITE